MTINLEEGRFDCRAHCRQIGGFGGRRTAEIYGVEYLRAIAAICFQTTTDRYYGGNRAYARAALIARKRHVAAR